MECSHLCSRQRQGELLALISETGTTRGFLAARAELGVLRVWLLSTTSCSILVSGYRSPTARRVATTRPPSPGL